MHILRLENCLLFKISIRSYVLSTSLNGRTIAFSGARFELAFHRITIPNGTDLSLHRDRPYF